MWSTLFINMVTIIFYNPHFQQVQLITHHIAQYNILLFTINSNSVKRTQNSSKGLKTHQKATNKHLNHKTTQNSPNWTTNLTIAGPMTCVDRSSTTASLPHWPQLRRHVVASCNATFFSPHILNFFPIF